MKPLLSIQYLRAFAALGVVAFHTGRGTILGQAGVDVFFVISGFIMWMVTEAPISPGRFLWQRILRVVPVYWVATLVMALHLRASPADIAKSLLFWPYYDANGEKWPVLVQGWTLNFEMFFYALFAATLLVPPRWRLRTLTATLGGLVLLGLATHPRTAAARTYTSPMFMEFLAGAWLCELVRRGKAPGPVAALVLLAIGLAGFAISLRGPTPETWRLAVWGIPGVLVVLGATSFEARRGLPLIAPLKLLGDASYSIYLFHPFVLRTVITPLKLFPALVPLVAVTAVCSALGIAMFRLVEKPLSAALRRCSDRVVTSRATAAARLVVPVAAAPP